MSRLIDAWALCELANNCITKSVDANDIMRFPTVDAVPVVHGHWERIPNTPTWKCSICGYEITGFIDRDGLTPMDCKVNYCSRCGAKMDESTQFNNSNTLDALERG